MVSETFKCNEFNFCIFFKKKTGNVEHPNCLVLKEKQKSFLQEQEYEAGWGKIDNLCSVSSLVEICCTLSLQHLAHGFP